MPATVNEPVSALADASLPLADNDLFYVVQAATSTGARKVRYSDVVSGGGGGGGVTTYANSIVSPPSIPSTGDVWFPSDSQYIFRYAGGAWIPWGPIFPFTDWDETQFQWINQGTATQDVLHGGSYITTTAIAGDSIRLRKKTAPATPYTITAYIMGPGSIVSANNFGLMWRESSTGKLVAFNITANGNNVSTAKWTNPTTFSATYTTKSILNYFGMGGAGFWFRIQDTGVNRNCYTSADGVHWSLFHTVGRTDFLTANEVGYYVNAVSATLGCSLWLLSWQETSP